jgi:hypothetical protein
VNPSDRSNRLGLGLKSCADGKSEKVVGIDPTGRVARAAAEISLGCVVLKIDEQAATLVKAGLSARTRALPTSELSITILQPGESEPVTVIIPALDDAQREQAEPTSAPVPDALSLEQIEPTPATSTLREVPIQQVSLYADETPLERRKRLDAEWQIFALHNSDEPGSALGPGGGRCRDNYRPFHDLESRDSMVSSVRLPRSSTTYPFGES